MQVSEVVRGDDLLSSTPRQLALYSALGAEPPRFMHVPLVLGPDGRRLSKRHAAPAVSDYRAAGLPPERIIGFLAESLGLATARSEVSAADLVPRFDPGALPRQPVRVDPQRLT
jgi:glutamyl-tRNA synthetase